MPTEKDKGLKIRSATVRDFARIKWAEVRPGDAAVFVIGGKNAQGKSSLINALIAGIGGKKFLPEKPVRVGAKKAETLIDLGTEETSEFTIRQYSTETGYGLEVRSKEGFLHPKGQTFLDQFYSKLSFDPFLFVRASDKERVDLMNQALGLDFSTLNFKRKQAFDERTLVNRDVTRLEGTLNTKPHHDGVPDEPVSVSALSAQLEEAGEHNRQIENAAQVISGKKAAVQRFREEAEAHRLRADELRKQIAELETKAEKLEEDSAATAAEVASLEDAASTAAPIDVAPIRLQIENAEATNQKIAENKARAALAAELAAARKKSTTLTNAIAGVDAEKEKKIRDAKFPIEGLEMTEDGVLLNGLPFSQASSAEQLRVSLNVAFRLRSELKVHFSREGGLFDEDSIRILRDEAKAAGVQVILEMPTRHESDEEFCSIIIEDGLIRGADEAPDVETFLDDALGGGD